MVKKLSPAQVAERKARVTKGVRAAGTSNFGPGTLKHVSTVRTGPDADEGGSPGNKETRPPGIDQRKLTPKR